MPIKYEFKERPLTIQNAGEADAQKIGEALADVKSKIKGKCNSKTALAVVARDRRHYLRQFLEWRNDVAAERYRQEQMRELMSCINIVEGRGSNQRRIPAFVSIIDKDGRAYHTASEVLNSARLQMLALEQVEAEMAACERRLLQFAEIANAIRRARELIAEQRRRYEEARPSA